MGAELERAQELADAIERDRFTVTAVHEGGEGASLRVLDARDGATRLLKVLDVGEAPVEVSLLASLRHPRVPQVLGVGTSSDSRAWLLREYFDGATPPIDGSRAPDAVVALAVDVLETLAYVHRRGILHHDIKPQNLLERTDGRGVALLDFGLGARGDDVTRGGSLLFAAPERRLGLRGDARSDLYSLGVTLHVLVAGIARARATVDPAVVGPKLAWFLPWLLEADPRRRPADADAALEALIGAGGRPSTTALAPDPIALHGDAFAAAIAEAGPDVDVVLTGGGESDRSPLALHLAPRIGAVRRIATTNAATTLVRGGGRPLRLAIPPMSDAAIAAHLADAVGLDATAATAAAASLAVRRRAPSDVHEALLERVAAGAIVRDGTRWTWPDAAAGRLAVPTNDADAHRTPVEAMRVHARHGRVDRAAAAFAIASAGTTPAAERELRRTLAEDLLRAGEAARALPFTHDLPVLRTRALLDVGRDREAAVEFARVPVDDPARPLLDATLAHLRGEFAIVAQRLRAEIDAGTATDESRWLLGLTLHRLGDDAAARAMLAPLLDAGRWRERPYLCAGVATNLSLVARREGALDEAAALLASAADVYRRLGHPRLVAIVTANLGVLRKDAGELDAARELQRRARALFRHAHDVREEALCDARLGAISLAAGDADDALRQLTAARARLVELLALDTLPRIDELITQARVAADSLPMRSPGDHPPPMNVDDARGGRDPDSVSKEVFRTFLAINRKLAGERDLTRALGHLIDAAVTLTGARHGYLLLARGDGLQLECGSGDSDATTRAFSRSLVHRALAQRRMLTAEDAAMERDLQEMQSIRDLRVRSALCVPFTTAGGTSGALYVEHPGRTGAFGEREKEHMEVLADQAAIAVERLLHEERLAIDLAASRRDLAVASRALRGKETPLLGRSAAMDELRRGIRRLADAELPVLIRGETGTGKELVARALHRDSVRAKGPFVSENCSALPPDLIESELFGHVRGAFTGADADRAGLLELASGGTLFLDEIGDMPSEMQAKLLRALQEGRVRRVGGKDTIAVSFRLLAATHKDLRAMVASSGFREDLYYRIAAAELVVPPLRERGDDVVLLAQAFLAQLNRDHRRSVRLDEAARARLARHPWPGNVRELQHAIARAFLLADGDTLPIELPEIAASSSASASPDAPPAESAWPVLTLREAELRTIRAALAATGGDKTAAAKVLGISRTALYEKLKRAE